MLMTRSSIRPFMMKIFRSLQRKHIVFLFLITCSIFVWMLLPCYLYDDDCDWQDVVSIVLPTDFTMTSLDVQFEIRAADRRLYLTEAEMVAQGKQYDIDNCAWPQLSKMSTLNPTNIYSVGEEIHVIINMYDKYGNMKTTGGDFLRIWMENKMAKASVSGHVIDHNNGSYTGFLRTQWHGEATIRCFLERRREELAMLYDIFKYFDLLWVTHGTYRSGILLETTHCSFKSERFTHYCNHTEANFGFSWYCERPHHPALNCDTWVSSSSSQAGYPPRDLQQRQIYYASTKKKRDYFPQKLVISTVERNSVSSAPKKTKSGKQLTSCHKLSPNATWQRISPTGVFYGGLFVPTFCKDNLTLTSGAYRKCLSNRVLWLHGDSTSKQFKHSIHQTLGLHENNVGHNPDVLFDKQDNISVSWGPHEFPFFHGHFNTMANANKAQHAILDTLANDTKDIIVLYLHVHFNLVHPDVYRHHIRRLVKSTDALLKRAPMATIAVRGPHAYFRSEAHELVSYWGLLYADILKEEFASVADRVVYLDYWDMTMAVGSKVHPDSNTVRAMVHYMMSLLCHRTRN